MVDKHQEETDKYLKEVCVLQYTGAASNINKVNRWEIIVTVQTDVYSYNAIMHKHALLYTAEIDVGVEW